MRRILSLVQIVWAVAGLGWLVVAAAGVAELRPAPDVVAGCGWLAVVWFWLGRTKTLTWRGYGWLFSLAVPWSYLTGVLAWWLSGALGGPDAPRVVAGFAPVFEESMKLLPLAALAVLAPGRVRRFATADWLLAGFALGLGFTVAEEIARRASSVAEGLGADASGSWAGFGPSPLAGEWSSYVPALGGTGGLFGVMAGHQVHTALVAAAVGLGVACWRRAARSGRPRPWRLVAIALPVLFWLSAVIDHAGWNSSVAADAFAATPLLTLVRVVWAVSGYGAHRGALLVLLLLACLLSDGARLARAGPGVPLVPDHPWTSVAPAHDLARAVRRGAASVVARSTPALRPLVHIAAAIAAAAIVLAGHIVRDAATTAVLLAAAARRRGTWQDRATAALTVTAPARCARETAYATDGAHERASNRVQAILVLFTLSILAGPVALAAGLLIDPHGGSAAEHGDWLAGTLAQAAHWWHTLTVPQQVFIGAAVTGTPATSAAVITPLARAPAGMGGLGGPPVEIPEPAEPPARGRGQPQPGVAGRQPPPEDPNEDRFRAPIRNKSRTYGRSLSEIRGLAKNYARRMRHEGYEVIVPGPRDGKYGGKDITVTVLKKVAQSRKNPTGLVTYHIQHFIVRH